MVFKQNILLHISERESERIIKILYLTYRETEVGNGSKSRMQRAKVYIIRNIENRDRRAVITFQRI